MQFFLPSLGPLAVSDHATGKALSGECLVITGLNTTVGGSKITPGGLSEFQKNPTGSFG